MAGLGESQAREQSQQVRNIDPFERKRRLANQQSAFEELGSRKVTSRREERQALRGEGVTPSEYMNMSRESYYQEFERPKGSVYSQALQENRISGSDDPERFKLSKQRQFLRGLRFNFIKDSYNRAMASPSSHRKVQIAIYAVPAVVSFGLAVSNYL